MKFYSLFLAIILCGCSSEDIHPKTPPDVPNRVLKRIDKIDKEISHYEKKAMENEVGSMGAFREDYSKFAEELEESEENEGKVRELEKEKEALLKQIPLAR